MAAPPTADELHTLWRPRPADAFAAARDWLRDIAGDATARALQRDARGRPRLPAGSGDVGWSHSGEHLLLAYVATGIVGVDTEAVARRIDPMRVARRFFAPEEVAGLAALAPEARTPAFLRLWCAKEAVLKAHGHGLSFGLHRLVFDPSPASPCMRACDPALGKPADWWLRLLPAAAGHVAVVARHRGILPG